MQQLFIQLHQQACTLASMFGYTTPQHFVHLSIKHCNKYNRTIYSVDIEDAHGQAIDAPYALADNEHELLDLFQQSLVDFSKKTVTA